MSWNRQVTLVIVVAAVVLFTNLGGPRLWDRDEPRNAGCAREMMQRGDWVTPVFNGELRSHKPVLLYWLIMTGYQMFGVGEFAARFWSAALSVGTAICTYAIGRRVFGTTCGLWAGIAVSTSLMFGVVGRAATPDATLIFFSTLALAVYVHGIPASCWRNPDAAESDSPQQMPTNAGVVGDWTAAAKQFFPTNGFIVVAMYAAMGLAVLAKGPVGLVMPTAVIGMFLLIMRLGDDRFSHRRHGVEALPPSRSPGRWNSTSRGIGRAVLGIVRVFAPAHFLRTCWVMRPLTAIAVALGVALPWYLWVGWRTDGEFLRGFFLDHNLGRATAAMEGHAGAPFYYPLTILVGLFPWSVLLVPIILETYSGLRRNNKHRAGYVLALCWIGVYVGIFTLARTKLPSYVTPCYPALALLVGRTIQCWVEGRTTDRLLWPRLSCASLASVGVLLMIALPWIAGRYLPGEQWLGALGCIPLTGGVACWWCIERRRFLISASMMASTATLFTTALLGGVADRVSRHQQNDILLAKIEQLDGPIELSAFGLLEPSWIFYGQRQINELHASGAAVWLGQWIETDGRWHPKPPQGLGDVAAKSGETKETLIITTDRHLERLESGLASPVEILADVPLFLKRDRLLLVRTNAGTGHYASRPKDRELRR